MHPVILLLLGSITTHWVWLLIFTRFLDHTQRRTTVGRTPLNEWSVRRRELYLTTHDNHNRQTSMPPRRAEDFYLPLKIRRLRPGLNPRTWLPKASRPPPNHRIRWKISSAGPGVPVLQGQVKTLHSAMNQPDMNRNILIEAANELDKSKTKFHSGIPRTIPVVARSKT